jgi:hypothetical protein
VIYVLSKDTVTVHELFKYTMLILYQRLAAEWQDLAITYPLWLTHVVMDEFYYTATLVVMSLVSFAVGLITGIVCTLV